VAGDPAVYVTVAVSALPRYWSSSELMAVLGYTVAGAVCQVKLASWLLIVDQIAASAGIVEGIARVLHDVSEISALRDGEILVVPVTAPSWAPVFAKIAAAVSDIGGAMSHAAIVAREYGMPAVVGCGDATRRIRTGDRVRVDGEVWCEGATAGAAHDVGAMLAYASAGERLGAGDVISTGTMPGCCGLELDRWIEPGQTVELEIDGIGTLSNVVSADARP